MGNFLIFETSHLGVDLSEAVMLPEGVAHLWDSWARALPPLSKGPFGETGASRSSTIGLGILIHGDCLTFQHLHRAWHTGIH